MTDSYAILNIYGDKKS